jgi:hypothetical protein
MSKAVEEILASIILEWAERKPVLDDLEAKTLFRLLNVCR